MAAVRETTGHLRFFHLIDAMLGYKYEPIDADVLLIGPGQVVIQREKTYPQLDEVSFILNPKNSHLHVVDKNSNILQHINGTVRAVFSGPWNSLPLVNEPINPNKDLSELSQFLVQRFESHMKQQSGCIHPETWQWNPVTDDIPHSKITLVYTHIIATYSVFYYASSEDFASTCAKLVRLLKQRGVLYIDQASVFKSCNNDPKRFFKDLKNVEELTRSILTPKFIPVAHRIRKKYTKNLPFDPKYDETDAKRQVFVGSHKEFNPPACQVTDTSPVWAITREIEPITQLEASFLQATPKDYWFYLAKKHFKKLDPNIQSIRTLEEKLGKESYLKTSEQGWTPLHVAVLAGNTFALSFFKAKGVPLEAKDHQEKTCIDYAELYRPDLLAVLKALE